INTHTHTHTHTHTAEIILASKHTHTQQRAYSHLNTHTHTHTHSYSRLSPLWDAAAVFLPDPLAEALCLQLPVPIKLLCTMFYSVLYTYCVQVRPEHKQMIGRFATVNGSAD